MSSNYEIKVSLPTKGLIYGEDIPNEVTLRHITGADEKSMFGSTGSDDIFDKIVSRCIVSPKDLDLNELIIADKHFLLMKLRIHTYGSEYSVLGECTHCGSKEEYKVNLDDFPVHELPDDFKEPIKITLPKSGDILDVKLLRSKDLDIIRRDAKRKAKLVKGNYNELEYNIRMARYITAIGDKPQDQIYIQDYVDKMHGMDSAYFWHIVNGIDVGYDTTVEIQCNECRNIIEFTLPITSEFFRPKFD